MVMRKEIIIAALSVAGLFPLLGFSQSNGSKAVSQEFGIGIGVNFFSISMQEMNDQLLSAGMPSLQDNHLAGNIIFSFGSIEGHFLVFARAGVFRQTVSDSEFEVQLTGTTAAIDLHYNLVRGKDYLLHPFLGVGLLDINLRTESRSTLPPNFVSALQTGNGSNNLSPEKFLWQAQAGLGFDYRIFKSGTYLGANAGYAIGLNRPDWEAGGSSLTGSPNTTASGFFVAMQLLGYF